MDEQPPYTSSNFHDDVQRQLVKATIATLAETKLDWGEVAPFLEAGRAMCREDLRNARLTLHGLEYDGAALVPAEEAYLSLSVRDREDGTEWLSQTWWLSDIALSDQDPDRVRTALAAIERSADKLREWLSQQGEGAGEAETPPTPSD
jgi:hypothetical protein